MSPVLPTAYRAQLMLTTDMIWTSPFALTQSHRRGSVHDSSVRLPSDSQACYVNEATRSHHVKSKSGVHAWTEMRPWLGSGPTKYKNI